MLLLKKIWVYPLLLFVFTGCRKSTSANWDVDVVVPVVSSSLNIKNFIGDSIFTTDNTGLMYLSMNREVAALKLDSLISLPDTTLHKGFPGYFDNVYQPGYTFPPLPPTELTFGVGGGAQIKRIDVRQGKISVKFSSTISQPIDLIYQIPNAVKNGQPFTISETVPTGVHSLTKTYDLSGYKLNMTGISGNKNNTIIQTYTVGISATSSSVLVHATDSAWVDLNYSEFIPEYVEGYFGKQSVNIDLDTARISLLPEAVQVSNFMLQDATMNFNILNEFGAEFSGSLSNIKSINSKSNSIVPLSSQQLRNINIDPASKLGSRPIASVKPVSLNSGNSNVTSFISNLPDKLTYQGKVELNPNTDYSISGFHDFAFYNTGIRIMANINIPMRFSADYFRLQSESAVNFSEVKQLDKVKGGNFVISATNGYPFDATMQAYLLDENGQKLDSLFTTSSNTIARAQLNAQNEVVASTASRLLIPVTEAKIETLRKTKTIRVISYFILPPHPPAITLYESYQFNVNIIAELNYNVGLGNN